MTARALEIMRSIKRSPYPIRRICDAYGIEKKEICQLAFDSPEVSPGPMGGAIDPVNRVFYEGRDMDVHHSLHEVMHIILAIPFWYETGPHGGPPGIEKVAEEWLMFPFEKAVAEKCLKKDDINKVIDWQWETGVTYQFLNPIFTRMTSRDYAEQCPQTWKRICRDSTRRCFQLGILDEDGPTFEWPKWERLSLRQVRWLEKAVGVR